MVHDGGADKMAAGGLQGFRWHAGLVLGADDKMDHQVGLPAFQQGAGVGWRKLLHYARSLSFRDRDRYKPAGSHQGCKFHEANMGQLYMAPDRKSTRLNSSHLAISYAVFCLIKKQKTKKEKKIMTIKKTSKLTLATWCRL